MGELRKIGAPESWDLGDIILKAALLSNLQYAFHDDLQALFDQHCPICDGVGHSPRDCATN